MFTAGLCLLTVVSCQTKQGTGTLVGTGAGAVIGGIVGNLIGKNTKGTAIGAAVGAAVGAGAGTLIGRHMDKVAEEAASNVNNAKVETVTDANGLPCVKLTFASGLLFATNKSDLSSGAMSDLSRTATVLKGNTDCDVAIIGHTDKSGNDNINIPLSQRRAESVANYLKAQGVSYGQIRSIQGVGSSQPVPGHENNVKDAANRRGLSLRQRGDDQEGRGRHAQLIPKLPPGAAKALGLGKGAEDREKKQATRSLLKGAEVGWLFDDVAP